MDELSNQTFSFRCKSNFQSLEATTFIEGFQALSNDNPPDTGTRGIAEDALKDSNRAKDWFLTDRLFKPV